jgi:hypothetical protein
MSGCSAYEGPFFLILSFKGKRTLTSSVTEKITKNDALIKKTLFNIIKTKPISKKGLS